MFRALIARAGRGGADRGPPVRPSSGSGTPRSGCAPGTSPWSPPMTGAGRIRGGDREAAYDRAAGAWLADHLHGREAILLAGSNEEAAELARRVQAQLVKMGTVVQPRAPLADGNQAGTGDLIRARLNTRIDAGGAASSPTGTCSGSTGWQGQDAEVRRGCRAAAGRRRSWFPAPTCLRRRTALRGQHPRRPGPHRRHRARAGHRNAVPAIPVRRHEPRPRSQYRPRGHRGNRPARHSSHTSRPPPKRSSTR